MQKNLIRTISSNFVALKKGYYLDDKCGGFCKVVEVLVPQGWLPYWEHSICEIGEVDEFEFRKAESAKVKIFHCRLYRVSETEKKIFKRLHENKEYFSGCDWDRQDSIRRDWKSLDWNIDKWNRHLTPTGRCEKLGMID